MQQDFVLSAVVHVCTGGVFTANTMSSAVEALGMAVPCKIFCSSNIVREHALLQTAVFKYVHCAV